MPKTRYTPEEIIQHLRTVELDTSKGLAVLDACRKLGVTEQTYYRWKEEYEGLRVDQAKRLKGLEQGHGNGFVKRCSCDLTCPSIIWFVTMSAPLSPADLTPA
jgi:transposase-like protein